MQTFRILYFSDSVLEQAQTVDCRDVLEAIEAASMSLRPQLTAEIWSEKGRVGIIGPLPSASHGSRVQAPGAAMSASLRS